MSGGLAAWALALVGLFNVIGAYSAGVLGGHASRRLLLSGIYFARAVVFTALPCARAAGRFVVLALGAAMGLLWLSTVPPTSGLVALMFGTRHVGDTIRLSFSSPTRSARSSASGSAARSTRRPAPTT